MQIYANRIYLAGVTQARVFWRNFSFGDRSILCRCCCGSYCCHASTSSLGNGGQWPSTWLLKAACDRLSWGLALCSPNLEGLTLVGGLMAAVCLLVMSNLPEIPMICWETREASTVRNFSISICGLELVNTKVSKYKSAYDRVYALQWLPSK